MLNQRCAMLFRRCVTLFPRCFNVRHWRCINVVQRWKYDVGFCFILNVRSTLFQRWSTTLKQRWSDVEILAGLRLFCLISFRYSLKLKSPLSWWSEFLLDGALIISNTEGCSCLLLSAVPEHPLSSQNFFIFSKKFFPSWLHPETFRCKPLQLRCFAIIFLLSMMLIFSCKRWFDKWETVRASVPLSICMVGVDTQTSLSTNTKVNKKLRSKHNRFLWTRFF